MAVSSISLTARPLHSMLQTGTSVTEPVLIQIRAPAQSSGPLPRLTAVLVLDVSGSMKGEPLAQVKDSVTRLAAVLGESDALGVIAFESSARTVWPITQLAEARVHTDIARAAQKLQADGSTNISAGLSHAALLFPPRAADERQVALLLSDGQPNLGTQTTEGLANEVELIKGRGIACSCLGFGPSHNEDLLLALAAAGGGRYGYIKDPLLAASTFARALGAQRDIIAEDVQLTLSPGTGVEIARVVGATKFSFAADGLRINLQDLILRDEIDLCAELHVNPRRDVGSLRLLRIGLTARLAIGRELLALRAEAGVDLSPNGQSEPEREVEEYLALTRAGELRDKARALADQRNFPGAAAVLQQACEMLRTLSGTAQDSGPLRDALEAILDDLTVVQQAPDPERYQKLRKAQLGYQGLQGGAKPLTITSVPVAQTPSMQMMQIRLQGTLGPTPVAFLVVVDGPHAGKRFALGAECLIGRGNDCHVVLPDSGATRRHALINWRGNAFMAFDLGSSNGTFVNGNLIERHALAPGDVIRIGGTSLRFEKS